MPGMHSFEKVTGETGGKMYKKNIACNIFEGISAHLSVKAVYHAGCSLSKGLHKGLADSVPLWTCEVSHGSCYCCNGLRGEHSCILGSTSSQAHAGKSGQEGWVVVASLFEPHKKDCGSL